jgi:long-chain acyl-CoA synthetase
MAEPPKFINIAQAVHDSLKRHAKLCFLRVEGERGAAGPLSLVTFEEFGQQARELALGLMAFGAQKGDRVLFVGSQRYEFLCSDIAAIMSGLASLWLPASSSDRALHKYVTDARPRVAICESAELAERVSRLQGHRTDVVAVVDARGKGLPEGTVALADVSARGRQMAPTSLDSVAASIGPNDIWTIFYTSGSSGEPKGTIRSHGNIVNSAELHDPRVPGHHDTVLVLSCGHAVGRRQFLVALLSGVTATIPYKIEMEIELASISRGEPVHLMLAPRVLDRIWNAILDEGDNRQLFAAASAGNATARATLSASAAALLGGRLEWITTGGAPLAPQLRDACALGGIRVTNGYGCSEAGLVAYEGVIAPDVEVKLAPDGEILIRSPAVMPGYFGNEAASRDAIDPEGWLHSGDLGVIEGGKLRVVGRKKDLFYCYEGSNIHPEHIESMLESANFVRSAVLVGDKRPHMVAFLEIEPSRAEVDDRDRLEQMAWTHVDVVNEELEEYERIRQLAIVRGPLPSGVKTPVAFGKRKVDRKCVDRVLGKTINELYESRARTLYVSASDLA